MFTPKILKPLYLITGIFLLSPLSATELTNMEKEIFEQPDSIARLPQIFYSKNHSSFPIELNEIQRIEIIGCGTSYHAGLMSKPWFEKYARIPVTVSIASEFTKQLLLHSPKTTVMIFISQSGETSDTLKALKFATEEKYSSISIVNNAKSSIAKKSTLFFCTFAGKEHAIAATKSFTTQLSVLAHLAAGIGAKKGLMSKFAQSSLSYLKEQLSEDMTSILGLKSDCKDLGIMLSKKTGMFCLGSGSGLGLAKEAALKFKETSYFQAEALPLGELKHGPLAMLDKNSAVMIIGTDSITNKELETALTEIRKREASVILLTDKDRDFGTEFDELFKEVSKISLPSSFEDFSLISWALPIQLMALYRSQALGIDTDNPRDLVKSVINN